MNTLSQKVEEIEALFRNSDLNWVSKAGSLEKNESHILANRDDQRIVALILSQNELDLKAYSVDLGEWLAAEELGLSTDDIMKNLVVLRMFNIRPPQTAKLQGNVFSVLELDSVVDYLRILPQPEVEPSPNWASLTRPNR